MYVCSYVCVYIYIYIYIYMRSIGVDRSPFNISWFEQHVSYMFM